MKYYFDENRKVDVVKIADNITIVSWLDKLNEEQALVVALGLQEIAKKLEPNCYITGQSYEQLFN